MHASTEENGYDPRKIAMVTNLSPMTEMAGAWKSPVQESNYESTKSAMVVHHSTGPAPMGARGLPIQEVGYDQAKSQVVIPSPALPTYLQSGPQLCQAAQPKGAVQTNLQHTGKGKT